MHSLIETGTVTRGFLGVSVEPMTAEVAETLGLKKETRGVIVTDITRGGPAEKAGLFRSDAILSINDAPVSTLQELRFLVAQMPPDTEVKLKVVRDGKEKIIPAKIGRLVEDGAVQNELVPGVQVSRLSDDLRRRLNIDDRIDGLLVTDVSPESPYADRIGANMLIIEINRSAPTDLESAKQLLKPGRNLFLVYSRGSYRYVAVLVK
jgi:serine protease Do/serine protease DegQ